MTRLKWGILLLLGSVLAFSWGCQKTYYAVWEQLGQEKRHLLKTQVEQARSDQEKASEEFKDALTRLKEIYGFQGGDLEDFYEKLRYDYDALEKRAQVVANRIERVDRTANDLFAEWENEIGQINTPSFQAKSRQRLQDTRRRYDRLYRAMTQAHAKMEPVLTQLNDYVLYLKHNLNAQAIGSLQQEVGSIEVEVQRLIADIGRSIQEADEFLKNFE